MTAELHFKLPDGLSLEGATRIPVEVTDVAFERHAVGRLGQSVTLGTGVYGVIATLPDGRRLSGAVQIADGDGIAEVVLSEPFSFSSADLEAFAGPNLHNNEVSFEDDADFWAPLADHFIPDIDENEFVASVKRDLRTDLRSMFSDVHQTKGDATVCKLALLTGNPWEWSGNSHLQPWVPPEWAAIEPSATEQLSSNFISLPVVGTVEPRACLFLRPGRRGVVVALPLQPGCNEHLQLRQTPKNGVFPHLAFCDSDLDLLLQYAGAGLLGEARMVADAPTVLARDFIEEKEEHPLGAALGFYLLLRLGDDSLSLSWTERLKSMAPWLPDGLVIHAELLARCGEHEAAVRCLAELPSRGLPHFTSGLSYAIERISQYERWVKKELVPPVEGLSGIHTSLRQVAVCSDPTRPVLTYHIGTKLDRAAFERADGKVVSVKPMSAARLSRSVEFQAPLPSPEGTRGEATLDPTSWSIGVPPGEGGKEA